MENRTEQNIWNVVFTAFYVVLVVLGLMVLYGMQGALPRTIAFFDLVLIVLATFRLIRLFVYDKVMRWFRDLFAHAERGPAKTVSDLLGCPWCLGLWMGTAVVFFYFLIPQIAWIAILILAIGGVASVIQLFANLVGWTAEYKKLQCTQFEKDS